MNVFGRAIASALTLLAATAAAQAAPCADRNHVVKQLEGKFGESLIANAVSASDDAVLEVYAAPDAATWSIVVTIPDRNLACLAATGKGRAQLEAAVHIQPDALLALR